MALVLVASCASLPLPTDAPVSANPAVLELMDSARNQANHGDYQQAKSHLERALRLEPQNAYLWFELAVVNRDDNDPATARSLAQRAQSFTGNPSLLARIADFIEGL